MSKITYSLGNTCFFLENGDEFKLIEYLLSVSTRTLSTDEPLEDLSYLTCNKDVSIVYMVPDLQAYWAVGRTSQDKINRLGFRYKHGQSTKKDLLHL